MLWIIERFEGLALMVGKTQLAAIIVTLSALVFVVYSITLLLRIYRRTDEGMAGIAHFLEQLRAEIEGFRFASNQLNALMDRSHSVLAGLERKAKEPFSAGSPPDDPPISSDLIEFTQAGISVLQSVAEVSDGSLAKWQREHRAELNRLLALRSRMEAELNELRKKCQANESLVLDLRRKNRSAAEAESATAQLRTLNQSLLADVREARRRQLEAEARMTPLVEELRQAKARQPFDVGSSTSKEGAGLLAGNKALRERIGALEAALTHLQRKLGDSEDALSRTLREKSMIEERFLQDVQSQ